VFILKKLISLCILLTITGFSFSALAEKKPVVISDVEINNATLQQSLSQYQKLYSNNRSPRVIYNLGVICYKLKKYPQAKKLFLKLLPVESYHLIAKYNLALVAYKAGDKVQAIDWFRKINDHAHSHQSSDDSSEKIKMLARLQLNKLTVDGTGQKSPQLKNHLSTYFFTYYGYDDSVTGLDPTGNGYNGDEFAKVYGLLTFKLDQLIDGFETRLSYYLKDYVSLHEYDFSQTALNLTKYFKQSHWRHYLRLGFKTSTYGALDYQSDTELDMQTRFKRASHQYTVRYRYDDLSSRDILFEQYQGKQQRLTFSYQQILALHSLSMGLELEDNERLNLASAGVIYNYSPSRQKIQLKWQYRLATDWQTQLDYEFRDSHYDNLNPVGGQIRDDALESSRLRLKYRLQKNYWLMTDFRYLHNQSSIVIYNYSRNILSLGLSATF